MRALLILFSAAFFLVTSPAKSQDVMVQLDTVPLETLRLSDFDPLNPAATSIFFVVTVTNDDQARDLGLRVEVSALSAGYLGAAETELGVLPPNTTLVRTNQQFDSFEVSDAAENLADYALQRGLLPPDEYQFRIFVIEHTDGGEVIVGEEDDSIITTNPGANLDLVGPGNEFMIEPEPLSNPQPLFQWLSNANRFEFALYEVRPGQVSPEDVATNLPVFTTDDIDLETLPYPAFAEQLVDGRIYAWQVNALVTTAAGVIKQPSDMFWFRYTNPAAEESDGNPGDVFVNSLTLDPQEVTIAPGESVRLTYEALDVNDGLVVNTRPEWRMVPEGYGSIAEDGTFTAEERTGAVAIVAAIGSVEDYATVIIESPEESQASGSDSLIVNVITPIDGQSFIEPSPQFAWQVTGADSTFKDNYMISLYGPVSEDNPGVAEFFWQHNVSGSNSTSYPGSVPALESDGEYQVEVSALDERGVVLSTSERVSFSLTVDPKISWELLNAWDVARRQETDSLFVPLLLTLNDVPLQQAVRDDIEGAGAIIQTVAGNWVQVTLPYHQLDDIASVDGINLMTMPSPHVLFDPELEPVVAALKPIESNPLPGKAPVKVAIFEFGFDQSAITNLVGGRVTYHSFRADGQVGGSNTVDALHGLASVQALFEHLPRTAEVHLINFDTEPEFQEALSYAVNDLGVDVITCSVSWANAYDHYDGTSYFSRSVVDILGDETAMIVAAGNFAKSHWEGPYRDNNLNGAHDFASKGDYLEVKLDYTKRYSFLLSWDDWGAPTRNLDIEILNENGERLSDAFGRPYASRNVQAPGGYVEPVERIRNFQPFYPGVRDYRIRITSPNRTSPSEVTPNLELYIYPPPESSMPAADSESSLASGLATARSNSIIPVGATTFAHSSQGPTNDGRVRPDFSTSGVVKLNQASFEGTSFATPRIAAVYASVKSMHPDWSISEIEAFIQKTATQTSDFTQKDNLVGWGDVNIEDLITKLNGE